MSPGVDCWIMLSAALFAVGLVGVMLRRSPLVILLSIEIMLNAGNLLLIAASRYAGGNDGQVFALVVMGVAAAEVVVGLGLIVALSRAARRRSTSTSCGACADDAAAYAAWLALATPLVGLAFTSRSARRVSRRTVGWVASGAILARLRRLVRRPVLAARADDAEPARRALDRLALALGRQLPDSTSRSWSTRSRS